MDAPGGVNPQWVESFIVNREFSEPLIVAPTLQRQIVQRVNSLKNSELIGGFYSRHFFRWRTAFADAAVSARFTAKRSDSFANHRAELYSPFHFNWRHVNFIFVYHDVLNYCGGEANARDSQVISTGTNFT